MRWLEVLMASRLGSCRWMGPKVYVLQIVARSKLGFSSVMKAQAAFSASFCVWWW